MIEYKRTLLIAMGARKIPCKFPVHAFSREFYFPAAPFRELVLTLWRWLIPRLVGGHFQGPNKKIPIIFGSAGNIGPRRLPASGLRSGRARRRDNREG